MGWRPTRVTYNMSQHARLHCFQLPWLQATMSTHASLLCLRYHGYRQQCSSMITFTISWLQTTISKHDHFTISWLPWLRATISKHAYLHYVSVTMVTGNKTARTSDNYPKTSATWPGQLVAIRTTCTFYYCACWPDVDAFAYMGPRQIHIHPWAPERKRTAVDLCSNFFPWNRWFEARHVGILLIFLLLVLAKFSWW